MNVKIKRKQRTAVREFPISKTHLEMHIKTFLYAAGFLHDEDEIIKLELPKGMGDLIPLTVKIKTTTRERMQVIDGDV